MIEEAQVLIDAGADPNLVEELCFTAISLAAERDDVEMVKLLLAGGADPKLDAGMYQSSALDVARLHAGNPELLECIREALLQRPRGKPTAVAMVALDAPQWPEPASVLARLQPGQLEWSDLRSKEGAAISRIPGGRAGWTLLPAPIPWSNLEWPCTAASWRWPEAISVMSAHQAHVVVFATSTELERLDVALITTRLAAAIAECTPARGVFWGDGSLVVEQSRFVEMARTASPYEPPVLLWIGFHPRPGDTGISAYTTGLESFGHIELEIHDSAQPAPDVLALLAQAASYLVATGAELMDGDTFGESDSDVNPVRHVPSRYLERKTVCLLRF